MNLKNMVKTILSSHYQAKVTDEQARKELLNLLRKQDAGKLDDRSEFLVARLGATGRTLKELVDEVA